MAKVKKSFDQINERIVKGKAVVLTADEMSDLVDRTGPEAAAKEVDVVTTGTFGMMCSSGAMFNFGHTKPRIKSAQVWFNDVPAYAGMAAVDAYLGATEPKEDDPLNRVFPGQFLYGGGHVLEDLVGGKKVNVRVKAYGTDCYPNKHIEMERTLAELPYAVLLNPRNAYQNYNCAVNLGKKTIYTYMGVLKPEGANATFSSAGQLSPLLNDPYYRTIGLGTRIFLGGGAGYVIWHGTQHNPGARRGDNGVVRVPAGTLSVMGDLKEMRQRYLRGASMLGYGISLFVGLGIPIPVLDEEMARFTGVRDRDIVTCIVDYSEDYPQLTGKTIGEVNYQDLRDGSIQIGERKIPATPLSSYPMALEIARELKRWILEEGFTLGVPQKMLPGAKPGRVSRLSGKRRKMLLTGFSRRYYRGVAAPHGLACFHAAVRETDLWIAAERDLSREAVASILLRRAGLEELVLRRPDFASTLEPWDGEAADPVVQAMIDAGRAAGVGPMAAVAGAIAEAVARDLAVLSASVFVENGGDIFLIGGGERTVGIWAGASPLSGKVGLSVTAGPGLSVCTSSGTVGPSLSFGRADAAVAVSRSGALADAAATALGNRIREAGDLEASLDSVVAIPGVLGAVAVIGDALGAAGDVRLVKTAGRGGLRRGAAAG